MAVYLFTFHAYRSWMPDHRRGYVQRGHGVSRHDAAMAARYLRCAKFDRVRFDAAMCRLLLDAAHVVCESPARPTWRLHIGVAVFNHAHLLVSWRRYFEARRAKAVLHRALTVALRDACLTGDATPSARPWLARGGSLKRVLTLAHFDYLQRTYLPAHAKYGGIMLVPSPPRTDAQQR